jgi:radical SAM superfamily enzyme YgiQ (UPF0313 family)
MLKVQLIYPRTDDNYTDTSEFDKSRLFPPPIGLEVVAANLDSPQVNVEIIDGNQFSTEIIFNLLDADFIGLACWYSNYKNCLKIAEEFKKRYPKGKVVFGGPNATILNRMILANRKCVDFVISGDGEDAFRRLVMKEPLESIPNLHFRKAEGIVSNPSKSIDINCLPLFSLDHLRKTGNAAYDSKQFKSLPISLVRGCVKGVRDGRCSFCAIPVAGLRMLEPEAAWKQIRLLHEKYGIRDFAESGDDFLVGEYPKKLSEAKPEGLDIELSVYANPLHVNEAQASVLQDIGVTSVFLGVEHANSDCLKRVNKHHTKEDSINAIRALEKYGIEVRPTFLYGLPGETVEEAEENYAFAKFCVSNFSNVTKLFSAAIIPLKGSQIFESIKKSRELLDEYLQITGKKLVDDDIIDYTALTKLHIKYLTSLSEKQVKSFVEKTLNLVPENKRRTYGMILK